MKKILCWAALSFYALIALGQEQADNSLAEAERRDGWLLLFDGKTHAGWMNSDRTAPRTPVVDGALNPHRAGHCPSPLRLRHDEAATGRRPTTTADRPTAGR